MSTEAVKKQILICIGALNLPLDRSPSSKKVVEACASAKLLRNRLLREHKRVTERIEALRQQTLYNEVSDDENDYEFGDDDNATSDGVNGTSRTEFIFISEMLVAEKIVIPLLLAHGMNYSSNLLPQLLKLVTALLMPIPRFSADETLQRDLLKRIKLRCGTDDFFSFLVQCVAPIAEKRAAGNIEREDVVLLEIVLTLINHLLDGSPNEIETIVGAFCRNHGIELLLVVINQNFSRFQRVDNDIVETASTKEALPNSVLEDAAPLSTTKNEDVEAIIADTIENPRASPIKEEICLNDSEDEFEEDEEEKEFNVVEDVITRQFAQRVHEMLESEDQLWKWNAAAMTAIASVLECASATELAQLGFLEQRTASSPEQFLKALRSGEHFRECKKSADAWRQIAKSRNGAVSSNGLLIRSDARQAGSAVGGRVIGTVSSLLGSRRKDPVQVVKDIDLRKRGRFIKGMFQDGASRCDLPLPTKIQLSQQSQSFMCFGFEPLSTMAWSRLLQTVVDVQRAANEYKEMVAGYRHSGETMELTSTFDTALYEALGNVLHYMGICGSLLHYIREMVRLMEEQDALLTSTAFQQQWHSTSGIISLEHVEAGFAVLRSFLQCKDLRKRADITIVVMFLAEMLLVLNLLLEGEIIKDPSVKVAAHALASSALYKEENIKTVFDLLSEYSGRAVAVRKVQVITLFTASVFQLMEKCSYKGSLLLPRRPKRQAATAVESTAVVEDDRESVNSATLEEMNEEMEREMAGMIDDGSSGDENDENDVAIAVSGEGGVESKEITIEEEDEAINQITSLVPCAQADDAAGDLSTAADDDAHMAQEPDVVLGDEERDATSSSRAASEAHPPSIASMASSGRTVLSNISSEREVAVSSYLRRLATPRNVSLLCAALRQWRVNDADVNLGLAFLMQQLVEDGCEGVFFSIAFLLTMREILVHGEHTHGPLYRLCDRVVFDFFNPPYARAQDARVSSYLGEKAVSTLSGAQSFLGFEVALRCARALFSFGATDYSLLEEKAMPHMRDSIIIPLPGEEEEEEQQAAHVAIVEASFAASAPALDEQQLHDEAHSQASDAREEDRKRRKRHRKESKEKKRKRKKSKRGPEDGETETEGAAADAGDYSFEEPGSLAQVADESDDGALEVF